MAGNKCKKCGRCCRAMFLQIGNEKLRKTKSRRDYFRWIDLHEKAKIVKIKGLYYLRLELKCTKLKNNKCSIYKNRPQLCRDFSCADSPLFLPDKNGKFND